MTSVPLSQICVGDALSTDMCTTYCGNNPGVCEAALNDFCGTPANFALPLCGCHLPASQYPLLNIKTLNNQAIPVSCDKRCQDPKAIPKQGISACAIGVVCIQSGIDITAVQSTVGGGITLSQNCGNTGNATTSSPTSFLTSTAGIIVIALIALIILGIILALVVISRNTKKKQEAVKKEQRDSQRDIERQQARASTGSSRAPTVVRLS